MVIEIKIPPSYLTFAVRGETLYVLGNILAAEYHEQLANFITKEKE